MKTINIYTKATFLARSHEQTVGEKNDYYITLAQLERICMEEEQGIK